MDLTEIVSDEQIHVVADQLPATYMQDFAMAHLRLSHTDIDNAYGTLPVTHRSIIMQAWKQLINRQTGVVTVQDIKKIIQEARRNGCNVLDAWAMLDGVDEKEILDDSLVARLSATFTRAAWSEFSVVHLKLSQAEVESQLPIQQHDLHRTIVCILTKWRNKNSSTATVQHLLDVLYEAAADGIVSEEAIEALYTRQGSITDRESHAIQSMLQTLYKTDEYSKMSPLHWDKNAPAFPIQDMYITMCYQKQLHHPSATKRAEIEKQTLPMKKMLKPGNFSGLTGFNRRILIEGQPGSGKTTLCKKLAYDWSRGVKEINGLSAYAYVFVIRLSVLQSNQSISEYIANDLLKNPSSRYIVEGLLAKYTCLLILDGYDELKVENKELDMLISGTLFAQYGAVVTSRPGDVNEIKNSFHLLYQINSLTDDQVVQFSQKYDYSGCPIFTEDNVERHSLRSFVTTPLYLSWVCMLHDKISEVEVNSSSELYEVIVNAMYDKAVDRSSNRSDQCKKDFLGLCNVAYRAMCDDEMDLDGSIYVLSSAQQDLGFTNTYYKQQKRSMRYIQYHNFNHKTLLEYLTAKHIVQNTTSHSSEANGILSMFKEGKKPVVEMLLNISEIRNISRRVSSQIVQFVLGLLAADKRCSDIQAVLQAVVIPAVHLDDDGAHIPNSHYGLVCVAQLSDLGALGTIVNRLVGSVVDVGTCTGTDCAQGIVLLLTQTECRVEKIIINSSSIAAHNIHTLATVPEIVVCIESNSELVRMYNNDGLMKDVNREYDIVLQSSKHPQHRLLNDTELESAFTNIVRYAWKCKSIYIYGYPISYLLGAWANCSKDERNRVKWKALKLYMCDHTDGQETAMEALLDGVELDWGRSLGKKREYGKKQETATS